jgi:hypothetical protein
MVSIKYVKTQIFQNTKCPTATLPSTYWRWRKIAISIAFIPSASKNASKARSQTLFLSDRQFVIPLRDGNKLAPRQSKSAPGINNIES